MKTDLDCRRETKAAAIVRKLHAAGVYWVRVSAGGMGSPYQVTIGYLNEREMRRVVALLSDFKAGRVT